MTMHDDVHLLAGAYALDALDPDERDRFERHLPGCETCQLEIDEFRQAATTLADAVAEPAPARLREAVLRTVDQTRQTSVLRPVRTMRARLGPVVLAAALLALVGSLGVAIRADRRADELERVAAVTAAPDARTADLVSTGTTGGVLRITYSPSVGRSVVVAADLPRAPSGQTYQLWYVSGDIPRSAGTFEPGGSGSLRTVLGDTPGDAQIVALTLEPDGGSPAPTSPPLYAGALAA